MKLLIAVTNASTSGIEQAIEKGEHHRVDYIELSKALGATYIDWNAISQTGWLRQAEQKLRMDVQQAFLVANRTRREGYDAVVSMSERVGIPLTYLLPRQVRHVVIMHHPLSPAKLKLIKALGSAQRFDKILVLSAAEAKALQAELQLDENRIGILRFPTDTRFYRPPDQPVPLEKQDHIESLGLSYRDYPTLFRAMRKLPHIPCYLRVGSLWTAHDPNAPQDDTLPANVSMQPFVPPSRLRDCYAQSRFIVIPMQPTTHWSAGSATVQQAQAMGKAVIATRLPGLAEYIVDGETGILVDQGDHDAMAEAIGALWSDPQRASAMGNKGRERIEAHFSIDSWIKQIAADLNG